MKTNAKVSTLYSAIQTVNNRHGYDLIFNRYDINGKYVHFTIRSRKSGISGARTSHSGRNLPSASWHAHGFLFEEIFRIEPTAVIWSLGQKITADSGNWIDRNVGSMMCPCYFSELSIL